MPEANQDALILQELVRRANSHTQRLRNIDEQIRNINSKIENGEEQKIKTDKVYNEKFSKIMEKVEEINKNLSDLKNEILKIREKEKNFAKAKELETVEKEMELLFPVKHEFVTWNEFNRELKKLKNGSETAIRP
jgi:cob(I)alamin adenosyltransferase